MSRSFLTFACESSKLAATLDSAPGTHGLLIVSGGNELRAGAWAGQAQLAAQIAAHGHPCFRFDRRGVGDSDGPNLGFRHSAPDIAAAIAAFRAAQPQVTRITALGNCDAASALMLAAGAGADGLILSNPWTFDQDEGELPAGEKALPVQALRAHYRQRLANPAAILRVLTGKVSLKSLGRSLLGMARPAPPPSTLVQDIPAGLARFTGPVVILLAERDRTAQAFLGAWDKRDPRLATCAGASHSFVEAAARVWLEARVLEALLRQAQAQRGVGQ
jgi:exosortase A-associated hydrolase 1